MSQPTLSMVQSFSGNNKTNAGYVKNVGILKKHGLIAKVGKDSIELTDLGMAFVEDSDPSNISLVKFHDNIKALLTKKGAAIFDTIKDRKVHDKIEVAKRLGYDLNELSGYDKDLSKMATLGFLRKNKMEIQLTDVCFPFNLSD